MQSPKEYLEEKIGPCVEHLFEHYLPQQDFKSIHDLFNVSKCYKLLMCILREQVKVKIADLRLFDQTQNQTYNQMRKRNFHRIYEIIEQSYDVLGWELGKKLQEKDISRMIDKNDMRVMIVLMEYFFQLLKDNTAVVGFITTLDESIQSNIMQVMQNSQSSSYHHDQDFHLGTSSIPTPSSRLHSKTSLQDSDLPSNKLQQLQLHMEKMQSHLQHRQQQLKELKFTKQQLQQQLQEYKKQLCIKSEQIEILKKRMMSYEQVDQLLVEKDEEIAKLQKRLTEQELKSRLKQSQLVSENRSIHQKLIQLDTKQSQLLHKYDKQKSLIQNITRQKDQSQISMKKVINNLKQKNKSLMDRVSDLQNQLIEAKFQKEIKEKQLNQIKFNSQNGRKTVSQNFPQLNSPRSPLHEDMRASVGSLGGGNYSRLGEQLSLQLDKIDIEDQFNISSRPQNKRFNQLLQENYSLKQQLQKLQSLSFSDSKQFKQLQDQIQKMKKKINILKRRNDEIENQHKEEIDIMVGIIDNCYLESFGKVK